MDHQTASSLFGTIGLIFFVVMFLGVLVYALWPKNRKTFDRAARMPLEED